MKNNQYLKLMVTILVLSTLATTNAAPTKFKKGLTIRIANKISSGLTFYTSLVEKNVFVLNDEGMVVRQYQNPDTSLHIGEVLQPLANGNLLTMMRTDENISKFRRLVELNASGDIVWEFYDSTYHRLNHDFQRLENGNTLILAGVDRTVPAVASREIKDDYIVEVSPSGQILWEWSTADHYEQLELSDEARQIIASGAIVPNNDPGDVFHTNSIQALPPNPYGEVDARFAPGNILVSQRNTNQVFIIDKTTGDVVWTLAKNTIGQHNARMIPPGLPGHGNITVFDNGGWAGYPRKYRFFSRALEVNPLTQRLVWSYDATDSDNPKRSFFSAFRGSVQRLENGNTLINEAEWGRFFEVRPNGRIVWEYINPYFKEGGDFSNRVYRAIRVGNDWLSAGPEGEVAEPEVVIIKNTPNPFNGSTRISFLTQEKGPHSIHIHDLRGRLIRQLEIPSNRLLKQEQNIIWDGLDLRGKPVASGSYTYTLVANGRVVGGNQLLLLK